MANPKSHVKTRFIIFIFETTFEQLEIAKSDVSSAAQRQFRFSGPYNFGVENE